MQIMGNFSAPLEKIMLSECMMRKQKRLQNYKDWSGIRMDTQIVYIQ